MNLTNLFEIQRKLDAEIEAKHPTTAGEDRLAKRILALQVELGECANEWRGFKFWSVNQEPKRNIRTTEGSNEHNAVEYFCGNCEERFKADDKTLIDLFGNITDECPECSEGSLYAFRHKNPLLEEYVDCLHFILSIGLAVDESYFYIRPNMKAEKDVSSQFSATIKYASLLTEDDYCSELLTSFYQLGEMLGFTWEQVEQAYMSKNKTNWERQANGY